jgi:hypothetical protein
VLLMRINETDTSLTAAFLRTRDPWAELQAAETMLAILVDRLGGRAEFTLEELEEARAEVWQMSRSESFASLSVVIEVRKQPPGPVPEADGIVDAELVDEPGAPRAITTGG